MSEWYQCEVGMTGPAEDGTVYINLKDKGNAFGPRWFKASPDIRKDLLATALTAVSTGYVVETLLDSPADYSVIHRMYVRKPGY